MIAVVIEAVNASLPTVARQSWPVERNIPPFLSCYPPFASDSRFPLGFTERTSMRRRLSFLALAVAIGSLPGGAVGGEQASPGPAGRPQVLKAASFEHSISGDGYRATINSYMCGDALAIAKIADHVARQAVAERFRRKAAEIKRLVQEKLWDAEAQFFKVLPRGKGAKLSDVRELLKLWHSCQLVPDVIEVGRKERRAF